MGGSSAIDRHRSVLTLIAPLDVQGQAGPSAPARLPTRPREPASRRRATIGRTTGCRRLITGQHVGIDKHRTHPNTRLGQQREHRGKSFSVDHHHRVAPSGRAHRRSGAASPALRSVDLRPQTRWLVHRAGAWTATDRCAPNCTIPWAAADRPPARSVPAPLDPRAGAGVGRSRTIGNRASRPTARPGLRRSGKARCSSRISLASKEEHVVAGCSVGASSGRARHRWPAADGPGPGSLAR